MEDVTLSSSAVFVDFTVSAKSEALIKSGLDRIVKNLNRDGLKVDLTISDKQRKAAEGIASAQKDSTASAKQLNAEYTKLANLLARTERYYEKNKTGISANPVLDQRVQSLLNNLQNGDLNQIKTGAAQREFAEIRQAAFAAGAEVDNTGSKLKSVLSAEIGSAVSAVTAFFAIGNAAKKAYDNVVQLDSVIVDLQIASDLSRKETKALVMEYNGLAKELGATTTEVAASADSWLRQGESIADTEELIRNSLMLSKLGQISSAEAAEALTSARKGYNVSAQESILIVDKLVKVDMEAAASAGGLAKAMAETANSARLSGIDMDHLIGYITTVKEVTQAGDESVGSFFRTLFARMGNVKLGKLVDPETSESLSDVETALRAYNIALRESNGDFRNFQTVLDEVAARWDMLGSVAQRAIAGAFSGKVQQENFITLMENYGTAIEYAGLAATSAGTALNKYESAYLPSVAAAQNKATTAFEGFSMSVMNSELIKGSFNAGAGLLGFLTWVIEKLGAIGTLAVAASTALGGMNKGILNIDPRKNHQTFSSPLLQTAKTGLGDIITGSDIKAIEAYNAALKSGTDQIAAMARLQNEASAGAVKAAAAYNGQAVSLESLSIGARAAAIGTQALNAALNAGIMLLVSVALQAIIKEVDSYIHSAERAKEKVDSLISAVNSSTREYEEQKRVVGDIRDELGRVNENIAEIHDNGKLELADEGQLSLLRQQRSELEGILRLEAQKEEQARQAKAEADKAAARGASDILSVYAPGEGPWGAFVTSNTNDLLSHAITEIENLRADSAYKAIKTLEEMEADLANVFSILSELDGDEYRDMAIQIGIVLGYDPQLTQNEIEKIKTAYAALPDEIHSAINQSIQNGTMSGDMLGMLVPADFQSKVEGVKGGLHGVAFAIEQVADEYAQAAEAAGNFADAAAQPSLNQSLASMSEAEDKIKALSSALKEFDDNGTVTSATLLKINDEFSNVNGIEKYVVAIARASDASSLKSSLNDLASAYLSQTVNMANMNDEYKDIIVQQLKAIGVTNAEEVALKQLEIAKLNAIKADMSAVTQGEIDKMIGLAQAAGVAAEQIEKLSRLKGLEQQMNAIHDAYGANFVGPYAPDTGFYEIRDEYKKLQDEIGKMDFTIDPSKIKVNVPTSSSGKSSSASKSSEDAVLKAWQEAVKQKKHALAMDQITQDQYVNWLEASYQAQLADGKKYASEWMSIQEEIYKHRKDSNEQRIQDEKKAWDEMAASQKHLLDMGQMDEAEYYNWLSSNYKKYLTDKERYAKEWQQYELELYQYNERAVKQTWDALLAEQKHNLEMGKISEGAYYKWVNDNYQVYLSDQKKYLDEWRRYQEDYYKWNKQQLESMWSDIKNVASGIKGAASGIKGIFDGFISLGKGVWDIIKSINDVIQSAIELRMKMITDEKNKQIASLNDQLNALKKYYDTQKKLLREKYEEEKYLEQQQEKRQDVASLEARIRSLSTDDSAWAQRRMLELQEELARAQKDLTDFERDRALADAEKMYDAAYEREEKKIQDQIQSIEDFLREDQKIRIQALKDILLGGPKVWLDMISYDIKNNGSIITNIFGKIDTGIGFLDKFLSLFNTGASILSNFFSLFTGFFDIFKSVFNIGKIGLSLLGFAGGTSSAPRGIAVTDESGTEIKLAQPQQGKYTWLNDGDKVFNAKASEFLYRLANSPRETLHNLAVGLPDFYSRMDIPSGTNIGGLQMGDIIIHGNADARTVSEIRRAQRGQTAELLKVFRTLQRT